jgi:hypothetical protein
MASTLQLAGYIRVSRVAGREGDSFISPGVQRERIEHHAAALCKLGAEWGREGFSPNKYSSNGPRLGRRSAHEYEVASLISPCSYPRKDSLQGKRGDEWFSFWG